MSIRLGDLLIQNKLITEIQLQEALHAQTIFGGKLGTNLVELGYLNEMDLSNLLSRQLGIPCIEPGELEGVDPKVLAAVPLQLVKKHMVFPLQMEGRLLRLAMSDPTNLPALDDVIFATGLRIDLRVAPEILLVYAIEKNYDVPRMVRYIRAADMPQNLSQSSVTSNSAESRMEIDTAQPLPRMETPPQAPAQAPPAEPQAQNLPPAPTQNQSQPPARPQIQAAGVQALNLGRDPEPVPVAKLDDQAALEPVLPQVEEEPLLRPVAPPQNAEMVLDGFPIHMVVNELIKSRDITDMMEVVKTYVAQEFRWAIIFAFSGNTAVGAAHVGGKLSQSEFKEFSFPVDSSEALFTVFNTKEPTRGKVTLSGIDQWYFSELKIPSKREVLSLPIMAGNEVGCIIMLIEPKTGALLDLVDQYKVFTSKVGLALELLTLKTKILDLSQLD
jgi:hypothetical protein